MNPPSHRISPTACPRCSYVADAVSASDGTADRPHEGDISICLNCGQALVFTKNLTTVQCPKDVFESLDNETQTKLIYLSGLIHRRGPLPSK